MNCYIPGCICCGSENFGLGSLHDDYVGLAGATPQFCSVAPYRFRGSTVAQWLRCCATKREVAGSIPAGVNGFFIDIKCFRSRCGSGVDSASNRNEYQEHFLG